MNNITKKIALVSLLLLLASCGNNVVDDEGAGDNLNDTGIEYNDATGIDDNMFEDESIEFDGSADLDTLEDGTIEIDGTIEVDDSVDVDTLEDGTVEIDGTIEVDDSVDVDTTENGSGEVDGSVDLNLEAN